MLDFEYTNAFVLCKAVMQPNPLKEILRDLDTTADTVVILFTPNYLSFYTVGGLGKIKAWIQIKINFAKTFLGWNSFKFWANGTFGMQGRTRLFSISYIAYQEDGRMHSTVQQGLNSNWPAGGALCSSNCCFIFIISIFQLIIPQSEQLVFAEFLVSS